jgi:hypothetical protein
MIVVAVLKKNDVLVLNILSVVPFLVQVFPAVYRIHWKYVAQEKKILHLILQEQYQVFRGKKASNKADCPREMFFFFFFFFFLAH